MSYLNSTFNFGIPPVLVFWLEFYYKLDRLLTGLTAQPKGTTVRWYSNKTSIYIYEYHIQICVGQFILLGRVSEILPLYSFGPVYLNGNVPLSRL